MSPDAMTKLRRSAEVESTRIAQSFRKLRLSPSPENIVTAFRPTLIALGVRVQEAGGGEAEYLQLRDIVVQAARDVMKGGRA